MWRHSGDSHHLGLGCSNLSSLESFIPHLCPWTPTPCLRTTCYCPAKLPARPSLRFLCYHHTSLSASPSHHIWRTQGADFLPLAVLPLQDPTSFILLTDQSSIEWICLALGYYFCFFLQCVPSRSGRAFMHPKCFNQAWWPCPRFCQPLEPLLALASCSLPDWLLPRAPHRQDVFCLPRLIHLIKDMLTNLLGYLWEENRCGWSQSFRRYWAASMLDIARFQKGTCKFYPHKKTVHI